MSSELGLHGASGADSICPLISCGDTLLFTTTRGKVYLGANATDGNGVRPGPADQRLGHPLEFVDGVRIVRVWTANAGTVRRTANHVSKMCNAI